MCEMKALQYCLLELRRNYDPFIDEKAVFSNMEAISYIEPILSVGSFDDIPVPLFHEVYQWAQVSVFLGSGSDEWDSQHFLHTPD